ncbi:FAD-dependent monooxygenase [Actinotalea ferrariae]|uniref:FAD-dependent oxidoreductase n=1 Tax=Actinotalea ferrariae TaxID=1386098 RepID=UPI001C8CACE4|nr:NAD(P)/FAD-dependent oxidoreductase [Actinotalea ferrariae]MBX9243545.1 FAD-dependent monooxygenase [Actinotalea ferrariae]
MTPGRVGAIGVVGGGIAGSALARALSLRGVACTVLERSSGPSAEGLKINLPGNAVRALAALGVADETMDRGIRVRRREYRNGAGRLLFAVDEERFWGSGQPSVCLRRGILLEVLRRDVALADVRWAAPVDEVTTSTSGASVRVPPAGPERFDLVVGADGVRSRVRAAIAAAAGGPAAPAQGSLMTETSWRFVVANPGVDCWTVWSGSRGTLLLIPVDDAHVYGYASATRGGPAGSGRDWLRTTFAAFPAPVVEATVAALAPGAELYHSPVDEVRGRRWNAGRLVLIGDAAHAVAPVWAQGAALALEDAVVLAALVAAGGDWSRLGSDLERARRPRVEHVQRMTDRMSRIARVPPLLRDLTAPSVGPRAYASAYAPLREPADPSPGRPAHPS